MTEERAREILGQWIQPNGDLINYESVYVAGSTFERGIARLGHQDGMARFTPAQLEAIAWWMRNKLGVTDEIAKAREAWFAES